MASAPKFSSDSQENELEKCLVEARAEFSFHSSASTDGHLVFGSVGWWWFTESSNPITDTCG